jgi:hypothetical protein
MNSFAEKGDKPMEKIKIKEETIWESPVRGKGAYCHLEIDSKTKTVSIKIEGFLPFEDKIKCHCIRLYDKSGNHITDIWTSYSISLPIYIVWKIVKRTIGPIIILQIYCSDTQLRKIERRGK